jgi:hypothetical protein
MIGLFQFYHDEIAVQEHFSRKLSFTACTNNVGYETNAQVHFLAKIPLSKDSPRLVSNG